MKQSQQEYIELVAKELLYKSLKEGRKQSLKVRGLSMQPLIKPEDEVFFRKSKKFRFGDLVVYKKDSVFIIHRFIRKKRINNKDFFILKADSYRQADEPVGESQIIGVVTRLKSKSRILALDSFSGKIKSFLFLAYTYLNLVFNFPKAAEEKDAFSKERKVLKFIVKDACKEDERRELEVLLKNSLDWQNLSERVKWNLLAPLFVKRIDSLGLKQYIPEHAWRKIDNVRMFGLTRDVRNRAALEPILDRFNKHNIEVMLIKGIQLGLEVYEDSYQRWMGDIDLLVKSGDWHKASSILNDLGFYSPEGLSSPNIRTLKYLDSHIDFRKQSTKIELKSNVWAIDFPYFDFNIWQRARKIKLKDRKIFFPSYEDTLLISCVNLIRHNFEGLIWFMDIKKIMDKFGKSLDWDKFLKTVHDYDLAASVYYVFYFTDKLFALDLPGDLLPKLKPHRLKDVLFNFFWDRKVILLEKEGYCCRRKISFECLLVLFCGKFNFRPRKFFKYTTYLLRMIFTPPGFIKDKCNIKISIFSLLKYYLLRVFNFLSTVFSLIFELGLKKR